MSLRGRLFASIAVMLGLCLLIEAAAAYVHARAKVANETTAAMTVGRAAAHRALVALPGTAQPYEHLLGVVRTFDGDRHLKATLLSANGEVVAQSQLSREAEGAPAWLMAVLDPPTLAETLTTPDFMTSYGAIALTSDPRSEIAEIWTEVLANVALTGAFFLAILCLVHLVVGRAIAPVSNLADAFASVGAGDLAVRLPEEGPAELSRVYEGFNRMVDRLAETKRRNATLTEQLVTIQDEERADLARDLHDDVSPYLFSVDVDSSAIARMANENGQKSIAERALAVREATHQMKRDIRAIVGKLRPSNLDAVGLKAAIEGVANFWRVRRPEVRFEIRVTRAAAAEVLDEVVFYVVREGVANAIKHAAPTLVLVWVETHGDELVAVVEDDGGGMSESKDGGYGLLGIEERVAAFRGSLEITPRGSRGGVIMTVRLPLRARRPASSDETMEDAT